MTATADRATRFAESLRAVGGEAHLTSTDALPQTVAGLLAADPSVLVSPTLGFLVADLEEAGIEARLGVAGPDRSLEAAFRAGAAAVTDALVGVAELGTVVVAARGGNEGLLGCLTPHHIVVLAVEALVDDLAQALGRVGEEFAAHRGEFAFITGPSCTADIEMLSVVGVHGPLRLDVVLLAPEPVEVRP